MSYKEKGEKMQEIGKKTQRLGGILTVLITIPIALTIFFGPAGAVIGGVIFIAGLVGVLKKKDDKNVPQDRVS